MPIDSFQCHPSDREIGSGIPTRGSPSAATRWLFAVWLFFPLFHSGSARAEGPGCTKDDLDKASSCCPADNIEARSKTVFAKIEACKGKLTQLEEANALRGLLFYYIARQYDDTDGCRRLAERGLHLEYKKAGSGADQIAESYGRCGGDCSKIPFADTRKTCERNREKFEAIKAAQAKAEIKAQTGKLADEVEQEQAVACDPKKARKLVSNMDQHAFHEQGLRFVRKYRDKCGKRMTPDLKESLANDEALLHFHHDDDAACVQALSEFTSGASDSTAFNRALCGGPCALDPAKCASAVDARKKALAARAMRAKRLQITQSLCWRCEPGAPCKPPMRGKRPAHWGTAISWDLKSARDVGGGDVGKPQRLHWTGDLNGDGIGDFVTIQRDTVDNYEYLSGREAWDGERKHRKIPYKIFEIAIGCGLNNEFKSIWREETAREPYAPPPGAEPEDRLDQFDLRIEKKPSTDLPSICIYEQVPVCDSDPCQERPLKCVDLSKWERTGSPVQR